jgi:dephospho-CoA kinase
MLIVTGPSCSGKSTFGRIAKAKGAEVIETTDVVKESFRSSGAPGEDIIEFCVRSYREAGEDVFATRNYERIVRCGYDLRRLVCMGFRAAGEVECFRRLLPSTRVIGIYADTTIRYERGLLRDRADCARSLEDFVRRDMREYSMGLAALFSRTLDVLVLNNGTMSEFEYRVERELSLSDGSQEAR